MSRTFLPNEDKRVGSISDLRNLSPETKHFAIIEGENSPADGGANMYWWDSSGDPANADGSSLVVSNLESTGVWRRIVTPNPTTTDDLVEGSTNTFYTDERAQDATAALLSAGNGVTLNYDDANDELTISASDLTTEEVQDDAWDVLTGTQTLISVTYDDANDEVDFEVESNLSNYTNDAGFITDISGFDTDDLSEGSTNLYFTDERVDDRVSTLLQGGNSIGLTYDDAGNSLTIDYNGATPASTTDELPEGSTNLYFTGERVDDRVSNLLTEGNGITLTYDDAADTLTIASAGVTAEEIQDDAWNVLTGTQTLIDVTYDDQNDEVDFVVESNLSSYTNDAGFITDLSSFTTDDLLEGSTNLYFTDERVDDRVNNLLVGGTNITLTYDDAADTLTIDASSGGTDVAIEDDGVLIQDPTEGINFGLHASVSDDGDSTVTVDIDDNLSSYTNDAGFITDLSTFTTDDLLEGSTNLYFTNERVDDRVNSLLVGGTNVTLTYDDGANSLTIDSPDTQLSDEEVQDSVYNNVLSGTQTLISVSYDDANNEVDYVVESNLSNYTNDAGFITDLSAFTTDDLLEGSTNLYFTDERVDDRVNSLLIGGTNVTLTYDDAANTLTIDGTDTQLSNEEVQDAVYNNILSGIQSLISVSYDDANNEVDYVVEPNLSNYNNDAGFVSDLSGFTTDDLIEGSTNLFYTDTRARNALSASGDLSYDASTGNFSVTTYKSSDFDSDFSAKTTDDLMEGTTNLYYDSILFDQDFGQKTTDDLTEGSSNLYYTDSRVRSISPTGQAIFDGGSATYSIQHGLGEVPQSWHVTAASTDAAGFDWVDADATNLIVNYSSAPPAGSQNVVLNWTANKNV